MAKAEGKKFKFQSPKMIQTNVLETFQYDDPNLYITSTSEEFGAVCPFSGLPDLAKVCIEYYPASGRCIELKSLKYYLTSFRNVGLYQEGVTKRIFEDLRKVLGLSCQNLRVTTKYYPRGGFTTVCSLGDIYDAGGNLVPLPYKPGEAW